jgi:hypothetical protein
MSKLTNKEMIATYKLNKDIKVGKNIICPICGKEVIKTHYAQAFCSNECKNAYWNKKGDRHKKGYYHKYNKEHPERLERGFTKGYIGGKVSNGVKEKENTTIRYDELGRAHSRDFYNPTLTDMINQREYGTWHDDDWCED